MHSCPKCSRLMEFIFTTGFNGYWKCDYCGYTPNETYSTNSTKEG